MEDFDRIQNRIYDLRGERVILDYDLASLYEVPTKVLNQAVKRNLTRFPNDFMFRISDAEWNKMRSQFVTASQNKRNLTVLPNAFTEQGVAMLSGIINSEKAINIAIMRAFVAIRKLTWQQMDMHEQLRLIKERLGEHDVQLNSIYDALENLLDEKAGSRDWKDRERIGFIVKVD
ncbi:ORF6N domain-containing protein [Flavihumibacter fluvii]|uniref:ORF6N domain-containing protein n=1 Tax=Flavihumibacter fluvii TaxID=2838157 RepID=UPI001BDE1FD9|nr:ORF6N domain-containing protein [Flavihumibacter fluvii]ULQ54022.1 ORF6N domain-containing protein [Flavihumibacter fluvii]